MNVISKSNRVNLPRVDTLVQSFHQPRLLTLSKEIQVVSVTLSPKNYLLGLDNAFFLTEDHVEMDLLLGQHQM